MTAFALVDPLVLGVLALVFLAAKMAAEASRQGPPDEENHAHFGP